MKATSCRFIGAHIHSLCLPTQIGVRERKIWAIGSFDFSSPPRKAPFLPQRRSNHTGPAKSSSRRALTRAIFVIDDGAVRVEQHNGKRYVSLAILGPGEFFGEMSFIDGAPTSARVVADVTTRLRLIDRLVVDNLSDNDPTFGARLYRSVAAIVVGRLRSTSTELAFQKPWM